MRALIPCLITLAVMTAAPRLATAQAEGVTPAAPAAAADPVNMQSGESPTLEGASNEMAFVVGDDGRITARVTDDVFATGGDVRVEGASADHLIMAAGEIEVAGAAVHDVIAAGGRIRLRTTAVADDVVLTGGELQLEPDARIAGSAVLTGGRLFIESPIGHELRARGGRVTLSGPVGGDAWIHGGQVVIGPGARIGGDLHIRARHIEISPQAVVQGRTIRQITPAKPRALKAGLAFVLVLATGLLVVLGLVAAAAPALVQGAESRLRAHFWPTAGVGALLLLVGAPLIIILLMTVIGIPLALFVVFLYGVGKLLAFAAVGYWIGQILRRKLAPKRAAEPPGWPARLGWTLLAGLLMIVVYLIPFLGLLALVLTVIVGVGAVARLAWGAARRPTVALSGPEVAPTPAA
jgi:cytoskeletal protein CcmA (bactofilin family)